VPNYIPLKKITLLILASVIIGCNASYQEEEFNAIQDVLNEYLEREYLNKTLYPNRNFPDNSVERIDIDTLDLKVYLSDALMPVSQIREDEAGMFQYLHMDSENSKLFNEILNSELFNKLSYREVKKENFKLIKPYRQVDDSQVLLEEGEKYNILRFSRICFDKNKENGIVVIDEHIGQNGMKIQGYYMPLLIKKVGNKWTYISNTTRHNNVYKQ
jgi:hypothetical protein